MGVAFKTNPLFKFLDLPLNLHARLPLFLMYIEKVWEPENEANLWCCCNLEMIKQTFPMSH